MSERIVDPARVEDSDRTVRQRDEPTDRSLQKAVAISVTVGLAALAAISLWKARHLTFIFDDWDVLVGHYDGNYLTPLNGHLIVVPILIYQALLHIFGLGSYYPFLVVGMAIFLAVPATFYFLHRRLASPLLVGFFALLYAWSKPGMASLFYPFLIDFNIPLVCLLVALHLTEADRRRNDLIAAGLVAIALASSGVGLAVAFAVIADVALRRGRAARLVLFAAPVVLWAAWYLMRDDSTQPSSLPAKFSFAWRILTATFENIAWGSAWGGLVVALGCVAVVATAVLRWRTVDRRTIVLLATIGIFVGSVAWARAGDPVLGSPDATWYHAVVFLLVAMVLVRCLRDVSIPRVAWVVGIVVLVMSGVRLVDSMGAINHDFGADQRPFLAAIEAMGPRTSPDRAFIRSGPGMSVRRYVDLVDRFGPVAGDVPFSDLGTDSSRVAADGWMIEDEHVAARQYLAPRPSCPGRWRVRSVRSTGASASGLVVSVEPGEMVEITAGSDHPSDVRARRFARAFSSPPIGRVAPKRTAALRVPDDRSSIPWQFEVKGPGARILICRPN